MVTKESYRNPRGATSAFLARMILDNRPTTHGLASVPYYLL